MIQAVRPVFMELGPFPLELANGLSLTFRFGWRLSVSAGDQRILTCRFQTVWEAYIERFLVPSSTAAVGFPPYPLRFSHSFPRVGQKQKRRDVISHTSPKIILKICAVCSLKK